MLRSTFLSAAAASILAAMACGDGNKAEIRIKTRDSSGVSIVEYTPSGWPPAEDWQISETPGLDIGVTDGNADYQLHQVRGALSLPDGGVVIAEFAANLRYYDSAGAHKRTIKMRGEGPGEAGAFHDLTRYRGDSLAIGIESGMGGSGRHTEVLILGGDGSPGRKVPLRYPDRGVQESNLRWPGIVDVGLMTTLDDGAFIVHGGTRVLMNGKPGDFLYGQAAMLRINATATQVDTISLVRTSSWEYSTEVDDQLQFTLGEADPLKERSFGNRLYHASGDPPARVDIFEPVRRDSASAESGPQPVMRKVKSLRINLKPEPHNAESRKAYVENSMAIFRPKADDAQKAAYRARRDSMKAVPHVPVVQDMRLDALGNIWMELYQSPGAMGRDIARQRDVPFEKGPSRWVVMDPDGNLVTSVMMPMKLELFEIGGDFVLGLWRDSLGVQHVRKHAIHK